MLLRLDLVMKSVDKLKGLKNLFQAFKNDLVGLSQFDIVQMPTIGFITVLEVCFCILGLRKNTRLLLD